MMRRGVKQSGFSLVEIIVVVATILILAGALLGVGEYLKVRAKADLTGSELEVIATALGQYYDDLGEFPMQVANEADFEAALNLTAGSVTLSSVIPDGADGWSSAALFYFLDRNPNSRMIVEALTDSLISGKDAFGVGIQITLAGEPIDLPRFIDAWGMSIRYDYTDGTAFPVLTSAGPDGEFDTPDDIEN